MAAKNRVGGLMDRRFGENDPTMNPEEKMLERFTRERQMKSSKGSLFNLEDEDDTYADGMGDGNILTHSGQALSLADDFDEGDLGISEDDEEAKRELLEIRNKRKRLAAGEEVEEEEPKVKKSKDEVMREVIAKSKMYKHERQMARQEDQNEIEMLDEKDQFEELMGELRESGSFKRPENVDAVETVDKDEEYEQQVRMLAFDRRAKPTDRTKTEDEIAKEKAEKLQKLERKRLARMNGEIDEDDESSNNDSSDDGSEQDFSELPEYGDIDDDMNDAEAFGLKSNSMKKTLESDDEASDEDITGNYAIDEEFHDFASDAEDQGSSSSKKRAAPKTKSSSKTAYTFDCPEDVSDLEEIFAKYPVSEYPVIVDRILTLYHPSLNEKNKEKLSVFTNVLAEFLLQVSNTPPTDAEEDIASVLEKLISQLRDLSEKYTESLSEFFREKLNDAESALQSSIESSKSRKGLNCRSPSYLFLFTLIGLLFSTSDHFHQIATPASLLIGQHLSQNKIRSLGDIFAGLYLCSTVLSYQRISKRYVPEVVQFLAKSIAMLSPEPVKSLPKDILVLQTEGDDITSARFRKFAAISSDLAKSKAKKPLALRDAIGLDNGSKNSKISAKLYFQTCRLVGDFLSLWNDKLALIEMFGPFKSTLIVDTTSKQSLSVTAKLEKLLKFSQQSRVPLALQAHRPIPIASNAPKFEENYNIDKKSYDPDASRQELSKLKAAIKKERKGALRELRKDSQFVAREKIKDRRAQDSAYHEKMARLVRTVATEEGAEKNKYEREKQARKRKNN